MTIIPMALALKSNPSRYGYEGDTQLINAFAENIGEEGKTQWAVYAHTGWQDFATLTGAGAGVKACLEVDSVGYVVAGTTAYKVTSGGSVTTIGTLTGATGLITMARNRALPYPDIAIASSGIGWWFLVPAARSFSTSGTTSSATAIVTGLSSTKNIYVGMSASGANINSNTTVASIVSGTSITLSQNAGGTGTATITFTLAANTLYQPAVTMQGTTTSGAATVTGIGATTNLFVGMTVSGTGVPAGTTILTIDSTTAITMSANATGSATVTLTFKIVPTSITEVDGYFVLTLADGRFISTDLNATQSDGLSFAAAESNPDGLMRAMRRGPDLVLGGRNSTEFWSDVGDETFPFSRVQPLDVGVYAAGSMCEITIAKEDGSVQDSVAWAATDSKGNYLGVIILNGYGAVKISNGAVDEALLGEADLTAVSGDFRNIGDHAFYTISGTSFTWEYDFATNNWNKRTSDGLSRWKVKSFFNLAGLSIYGDYAAGALYKALPSLFAESGTAITWTIIAPPLSAHPYQLQINALFLDVIPASGLSYSASNTISISYSQDGGVTYSTARTAVVSPSGRPLTKITERMFGVMHEAGVIFKMSSTAAVVNGVVSAAIDAEKLSYAA